MADTAAHLIDRASPRLDGPCPPVDEYQQTFLSADATPIGPTAARIAIGVHTDTVAQQAALVDFAKNSAAEFTRDISEVLLVPMTLENDHLAGKGLFRAGDVAAPFALMRPAGDALAIVLYVAVAFGALGYVLLYLA